MSAPRRLALACALVLAVAGTAAAQGMLGSKHNLSVTGPGEIRATSETEVCVFCHTPHNATPSAPLWNKALSGQSYSPYASNTLQSTVGQPNGYSRLCLSCHDGSLAVGAVINVRGQSTTIAMQNVNTNGSLPSNRTTYIGTNLTNDHPISFAFTTTISSQDQELVNPTTLTGAIRLYEGATSGVRDSVQCTTCHDPHLVANPYFLKQPFIGQASNLCLTCHTKPGWAGSSHESSTKLFGSTSVADLSCGACHRPHTDQGAPRLLRGAVGFTQPAMEQTCYRCHKAAVSGGITFDLQTQFAKTASLHRITAYAGHEPVFPVGGAAEGVLNSAGKHVECVDCHNPHRVRAIATAGTGGVYEGMRGINLAGNVVDDTPATGGTNLAQYEICLRCHGDSYATAVGTAVDGDQNGARSANAIPTSSKRAEFQTTNSAYHPVPGTGRNNSANLGAQLSPNFLSVTSTIVCTDCHNNNFYSGTTYRGPVSRYTSTTAQPKGPHGSDRFNLLRARFWNVLPGPSTWNSTNFDLCFQCHDVTALTARRNSEGARTNFSDEGGPANGRGKQNLHWFHLRDRISIAQAICKSCHYNIHSNVAASNTQYKLSSSATTYTSPNTFTTATGIVTRMVNFHPNVRGTGGRPRPEWEYNTGTKERRCFLVCHGTNGSAGGGATMSGYGYRPSSGDLTGAGS